VVFILLLVVVISAILMGIFPIFFKRWNEVNVEEKYGTLKNCTKIIYKEIAVIWSKPLHNAEIKYLSKDFLSEAFNLKNYSRLFDLIDRYLIAGILTGFLGYIIWIFSLRFGEVSILFSITSLQFIATWITGYLYLKERLTPLQVMGIVSIILGVALIAPQV